MQEWSPVRGQHWRSDNYRCVHCKGGNQVLEDERKKEEAEQKKEAERIQEAKEDIAKSTQSLQDSEHTLMREEVVKADLKAPLELMSDATSKLHDTRSAADVNKQTNC